MDAMLTVGGVDRLRPTTVRLWTEWSHWRAGTKQVLHAHLHSECSLL